MSPIPKSWRSHLRGGARARLRGALQLDESSIPLEATVRVDLDGEDRISLHLTLPVSEKVADEAVAQLSARERTIISLIGTGKGTDEIAGRLFISPSTVRTHVRNAMSKLGAHTRAELVARVSADGDGLMDPIGESTDGK
jgi:DNA-binding CsgD family transcriptional regulator